MTAKRRTIRIVLVDDHPVVRSGLRMNWEEEPDFALVGEAVDENTGWSAVSKQRPDVLVLDLSLNGRLGLALLKKVKERLPQVRVLVLTQFADPDKIREVFAAHAEGFLMKDVPIDAISEGIRTVARGGRAWDERATHVLADSLSNHTPTPAARIDTLNYQEKRIAERVARGLTNRQIAAEIELSDKTVRNYLSRIMDKVGVGRRAELAALYTSAAHKP